MCSCSLWLLAYICHMKTPQSFLSESEVKLSISACKDAIDKELNVIKEAKEKIAVFESVIKRLTDAISLPLFSVSENTLKREAFIRNVGSEKSESKLSLERWANLELPSSWSEDLTYPEKVLFVISQIQPCNSGRIAAKLVEYGIDEKRAKSEARHHSSRFKLAGRLEVVKKGSGSNGDIVRIKEKTA